MRCGLGLPEPAVLTDGIGERRLSGRAYEGVKRDRVGCGLVAEDIHDAEDPGRAVRRSPCMGHAPAPGWDPRSGYVQMPTAGSVILGIGVSPNSSSGQARSRTRLLTRSAR